MTIFKYKPISVYKAYKTRTFFIYITLWAQFYAHTPNTQMFRIGNDIHDPLYILHFMLVRV